MTLSDDGLHNAYNPYLDPRVFANHQTTGRPPSYASVTYWYRQLLSEGEGKSAIEIAHAVIDKAKQGSMPHVIEITDRTEGKVASDVNVRGVVVHVGDDYARMGIEAIKADLDNRRSNLIEGDKTDAVIKSQG